MFRTLFAILRRRTFAPDTCQWHRDPLSHPALRGMDERGLADLPFDPRKIAPD